MAARGRGTGGEGRIAAEMAQAARAQAASRPAVANAQGSSPAAVNAMIQQANVQTQQAIDYWQRKDAATINQPAPSQTPTTVTPATTPATTPAVDPYAYERAMEAERKRIARQNALTTIRGALESFGLTSLLDVITGWVQQDFDAESIMVLIRQTQQYKDRFPAMEALAKKGRALSEAEYIAFERNAAQLERAYGLPAGMLGKDAVTRLLTNEVSAAELENRVTMAAAGAFQTSDEVKRQFRNYYGIDSGGLTAYFLDPERAMPLLQKQYVSAQIGAEAAMQSIDLGVSMAEELQIAGIERQQAREGFGRVAGQRELSMGRGDIVSQQQLIGANLKGDTAAGQAIERAGAARVGRFAGGGQFLQTQQGNIGLGSAATR